MPALRWRWVRMLDPFHESTWRAPNRNLLTQLQGGSPFVTMLVVGKVTTNIYLVKLSKASVHAPYNLPDELWLCSNAEERP